MVISATADSFFTNEERNLRTARDVVLFAVVFFAVMAILPVGGVVLAWVFRDVGRVLEDEPRFAVRKWVLIGTSVLVTTEVGFRAGQVFEASPAGRPGWFDERAAYYCFVFAIEVTVVYVYVILRLSGWEY
ncbi:hypothetical protein B0T16DRAFT_408190 [Cercophora newfieldiana]|uniref:Uncharacterized protein n=1 Tax=Cercophora newfieldiana TaxID=92897 RepID=A0AA39YBG1_9PEZI|nr:hypothetical protein B0T16DRAFT_408190 [Cercophora newfieldiana]